MNSRQPVIIGIAGGSGSGKTTIARQLLAHYGENNCLILSADHYYQDQSDLTPEERATINYDHPDSIDFDLLTEHVYSLKIGQAVERPNFDFCTHTRMAEKTQLNVKPIIIVEGILVFHPVDLFNQFDLTVFIDALEDSCLKRRMQRDVNERGRTPESVIAQYQSSVLPMFRCYLFPTKAYAQFIVKNIGTEFEIDISPITNTIYTLRLTNEPAPVIEHPVSYNPGATLFDPRNRPDALKQPQQPGDTRSFFNLDY